MTVGTIAIHDTIDVEFAYIRGCNYNCLVLQGIGGLSRSEINLFLPRNPVTRAEAIERLRSSFDKAMEEAIEDVRGDTVTEDREAVEVSL